MTATTKKRKAVQKRSAKLDDIFFAALASGEGVNEAARAANYSYRAVFNWRNTDEAFAERWDEARNQFIELLEIEADRRAMLGTEEPVFYQGQECGKVRKYSDNLLMFRLKALAPDTYRERQEVKHVDKAPAIVINRPDGN